MNCVLIYIPEVDRFMSISLGDGTNSLNLCEGCDSYLYINAFVFDLSYQEFSLVDGGQLDFNSEEFKYFIDDKIQTDAIDAAVEFIYGDKMDYNIIKYYNV